MANDLTVPFSASVSPWNMLWAEGSNAGTERLLVNLFLLLLSLGQRWCCAKAFRLHLAPVCPPLWAGTHADCLACCFAPSLASVFFPISNYLLVSEVQPRIVHSISPTSSSPFGHRGVFRGESRLWHACLCRSGVVHWKSYTITDSLASSSLSLLASREWLERKCGSMLRTHQGREVWPRLCLLASPHSLQVWKPLWNCLCILFRLPQGKEPLVIDNLSPGIQEWKKEKIVHWAC